MEVFAEYLSKIVYPEQREKTETVLRWVAEAFPNLMPKIAWNQPMFTEHGTFIIGFSASKNHLAVTPETACMEHFSNDIQQCGYERTKGLIRIKWNQPVNFPLLEKMIQFNLTDKKGCTTFWRK